MRVILPKNIYDKEKERFWDDLYIIINIINNKYKLLNFKTSEEVKRLYKHNELLKTNNDMIYNNKKNDIIINHNKKIKVKRNLKKEGVDNKNIINDRTRKQKEDNNIKNRLRK